MPGNPDGTRFRVSGVTLLGETLGERRPGYRDDVHRTNGCVPGPPKG